MRDLNRLNGFYDELKKIHMEYFPDWRFGQLCSNFLEWLFGSLHIDPFFIEEDRMLQYLKQYVEKENNYKISKEKE